MTADAAQSNKWVDRATAAVNATLVVVICYLLVKLVFLLLDSNYLATPPALVEPVAVSQQTSQGPQVDPSIIPRWNLLGKEGVRETSPTPVVEKDAPKSTLPLELRGVFVAQDEAQSSAIIAERGRQSESYNIGESVPGNATLAAVFADRVLLNTRGRLEALYFPDHDAARQGLLPGQRGTQSNARASTQHRNAGTRNPVASRGRPVQSGGQIEGMIQGTVMPTPEEVARVIRQEFAANAQNALSEMGLEQNNGRGYKVSESGSPLFSAIGARPGDVVLAVNGRPLGNPDTDMTMLEDVLREGRVIVNMERNGRNFNAEVPLEF